MRRFCLLFLICVGIAARVDAVRDITEVVWLSRSCPHNFEWRVQWAEGNKALLICKQVDDSPDENEDNP